MRTRRFERLGLALLLVIGCIVFDDRSLIEDAQAQQQSAPPPPPTPPTQSSAVNPSNPSTAPQQSYTPLKPSTQSTTPSTSTTSSSELTPGHQASKNALGPPLPLPGPPDAGHLPGHGVTLKSLDKSPTSRHGGRMAVFVIAGIAGTDCSLIEIIC